MLTGLSLSHSVYVFFLECQLGWAISFYLFQSNTNIGIAEKLFYRCNQSS